MDKNLTCRAATNIAWFQVGLAWASANLLPFLYLSPHSEKRPSYLRGSAKMPPSAWARCWSPSLSSDAWLRKKKRSPHVTEKLPRGSSPSSLKSIEILHPSPDPTWCCPRTFPRSLPCDLYPQVSGHLGPFSPWALPERGFCFKQTAVNKTMEKYAKARKNSHATSFKHFQTSVFWWVKVPTDAHRIQICANSWYHSQMLIF